ncbi:MAG TPA: hypothetical protein VEL28_15225 [Candidatus Binatia bacterium]|nr:hypothetical protein [Candidatus Binatia bacterium]
MADQQDLTTSVSALCDRAVFTSLPSATGEGYRIVAASAGVRSEERTEIIRRSPSHDSLCSRAPQAAAIAMYSLESGRVCISLARYAGAEHTMRGGGRVWTDVLFCDPAAFVALGSHPDSFCRAAAMLPPLGKGAGAVVAAVEVGLWRDEGAKGSRSWDGATLAGLASLLHERTAAVAAAGKNSAMALVWALHMLPAASRRNLSCSGGLRFSRMRQIGCTVVDDMDQDTLRATRGHGIRCHTAAEVRRLPPSWLQPWLSMAARWWDEGRAGDIVRVASAMVGTVNAAYVSEVAAMCEAVDRQEKEPAELDWLLARRVAA